MNAHWCLGFRKQKQRVHQKKAGSSQRAKASLDINIGPNNSVQLRLSSPYKPSRNAKCSYILDGSEAEVSPYPARTRCDAIL